MTAQTDASRIEQILTNLLGNAIRHTPAGTQVLLALGEHDGVVDFTVKDEGPGVSQAEVEEIFDIYVTKAGEEAHGHGLGLPLSRRLARLLGGELVAEPDRSGGLFRLSIPLAPSPPQGEA